MSRCFPFPPPGYLRNSDALIEDSIKLRLHMEKLKDKKEKRDKKERKRDKEERKRHKEEKREKRKREKENKQKESTTSPATVCGIKIKLSGETKEPKDNGKVQKSEDYENELLERSGITEELDKPVCSPQEPYSSDSSHSSKRKRATLLPSQEHGPAIRIRVPLRKHREPEESKQGFQLASSSRNVGIADSLAQVTKRTERPLQDITEVQTAHQLPGNSNSEVFKPLQNLVTENTLSANKTVNSRRVESLYESLLRIPHVTYDGLASLDQDWLFSSRPTEAKPVSKKLKTDACSKSLWPLAQYIPEVDIYALPYTVPF